MEQLDWNLVRAFSATAAAGSMTRAARTLGLTQPTLSRQIAALEASLGVTLFERVGRRLALTDAARELLEHVEAMRSAADGFALAAAGQSQQIEGRVTVSASDGIAVFLLPDIITLVRAKAPQVTVSIVASNALSDLRRREADIAIRHVRPDQPELIGTLARETYAHVYASEAWIAARGRPDSFAALKGDDILCFDPPDAFAAHLRGLGAAVKESDFRLISANSLVLWELARRGLGVCYMLSEIADRTPGMVRLFPDMPGMPVPLWVVCHRELRTSRRCRLVFEMLVEQLRGRGAAR